MSAVTTILDQIQPLVTKLSAEERLTLIRSIAQLDMSSEPTVISTATIDGDVEQQMLIEQEAWFRRPAEERILYRGCYIAIHHGTVIDQDTNRRTLLRRVRTRFRDAPIPVISGDDDSVPEYVVHSPQLMR